MRNFLYARLNLILVCGLSLLMLCSGCSNPKSAPSKDEVKAAPGKPGGIPNVGNTCYLNASLQILAAFYADMFDDTRGWLTEEGKKLACAGKNIIAKINTEETVSEQDIKEFFNVIKPLCGLTLNNQEDAHELLVRISDLLVFPKAEVTRTNIDVDPTPENRYSNHVSRSIPFTMLLVHLYDSARYYAPQTKMQDCVDQCFEDETLTDVEWKTNDRKEARVESKLSRLSNLARGILPIYAVRFKHTGNTLEKLDTCIKGTTTLILRKEYIDTDDEKTDILGDLVGIIVHSGTYGGGHYVAYVKKKNTWYLANDATVTEVTTQKLEEEAEKAYMYFYKLKN